MKNGSLESDLALITTKPTGRYEKLLAFGALAVSALLFAVTLPFVNDPFTPIPAFIPAHVSVLVICDLITSALLFSHYRVTRLTATLALAGGYFFTSASTFAYAILFPGLLPLAGIPSSGPQTSSAMYMFWHAGFPISVIAYALLKSRQRTVANLKAQVHGSRTAIAFTVIGILIAVVSFSLFATWGHRFLPVFIHGDTTTTAGRISLVAVWSLSMIAIVLVWKSKPYMAIDMWLIVVMCVWLFDMALAAIFNSGRYDVGWYVGRIYGVLAASLLLILLLWENMKQYALLFEVSRELDGANQRLTHLSQRDGLTGLANRRHFDDYLREQIALANRHKRSVALILFDVDHFKMYNDHYGHQAGDACLKRVAAALQSSCHRPADFAARYGGEEFVMVLPDTEPAGAVRVAESVIAAVANLDIPHAHSATASHVTISAGLAYRSRDSHAEDSDLLGTADKFLYRAKSGGRNRLVCS